MNDRSHKHERKPSICFVAPNNYAVLSGRTDLGHIGGTEIQQPMIGRELACRGSAVSFVTLDHGQPDGIVHDALRVHKMCRRDDGLPGLRFVHPRWTSLCSAMARADADVYYQMNNGAETGQVALWCHRNKRIFIFAVSSDSNCKAAMPGLRTRRERLLYRWGLRHADAVIAQTETQHRMLADELGVSSVLIRSCSVDPYDGHDDLPTRNNRELRRILWVGRFAEVKRLEMLLDVAGVMSDVSFDVVGERGDGSAYGENLLARAESLDNVTLHGRVPHAEIGRFYEQASLLACTSHYEGYPNTFMEAWARGIPTVATVDPDGVVHRHGLGMTVSDVSEFVNAVNEMLAPDGARWHRAARLARGFYLENHTVKATVDAYSGLLSELLGLPVGRRNRMSLGESASCGLAPQNTNCSRSFVPGSATRK